jgi:hypothetical protein
MPSVQQRRSQLVAADDAAWAAYGAAVQRCAPAEVRRSLFGRAMMTLGQRMQFEAEHEHGSG